MSPTDIDIRAGLDLPPESAGIIPSQYTSRALIELAEELSSNLLDWLRDPQCHPGVRGFGFGVRWVNGRATDVPVLQVYVAAPISADEARPANLFPRQYRKLAILDCTRRPWEEVVVPEDAPVEVVVTGEMRALSASAEAAALRALALSSSHVLAGDVLRPKRGGPVIQPGAADLGSATADVIGLLVDAQKLYATFDRPNYMDAALCELLDPTSVEEGIDVIGEVPTWRALHDVAIGLRVAKVGRTTGLTFGVVKALCVTFKVDYGLGEPLLFSNQILTSHIASGGDSGAVLIALGPQPSVVGLLLGGSMEVTLATPIEPIHDRFEITTAPERWVPRGG